MRREELADLNAFVAVAEERSFTRAAAKLGTSQSALSFTVRRLEERLGVRLLSRTTRSVAPTEAGERLLGTLGPALDKIGAELAALSELREKPAGTIRITAGEHAAEAVLWPALATAVAALSRHQGRAGRRLRPDRHRRRALRRRRSPRRAGGERHDRRAHRSGLPHGRRRSAFATSQDGRGRSSRRTLRTTTASISACRPTAGSSPGSSRSAGASSRCGSKDSWFSPTSRCG